MRNNNQVLDKKQMVNSSYEVQFFICEDVSELVDKI